jgi:hypothetical protein
MVRNGPTNHHCWGTERGMNGVPKILGFKVYSKAICDTKGQGTVSYHGLWSILVLRVETRKDWRLGVG